MENTGNSYSGRGGGGGGRGRGRGRNNRDGDGSDGGGRGRGRGGRGDFQNQGRGNFQNQRNQQPNQGGGGNSGGGGGGGYQNPWNQPNREGGGNGGRGGGVYQNQPNREGGGNGGGGRGDYQNVWNREGGGGGGRGGRGDYQNQPNREGGGGGRGDYQNVWNRGGGGGGGRGRGGVPPAQQQWSNQPQSAAAAVGAWSARPAIASSSSSPPPPRASADRLEKKVSEQLPPPPPPQIDGKLMHPIRRPDRGGTVAVRSIRLLVNHFPVQYDPNKTIFHYDVDIKPKDPANRKPLRRADLRSIRNSVFSEYRFPNLVTAYDGEKNIFSAVNLPTGLFEVKIPGRRDGETDVYKFTIHLVSELKLSKLDDYLKGRLSYVPRDILQGMDLVMKENPSEKRIFAGRSYFPEDYSRERDISRGLKASRGFHQTLKSTSQGLVLCLDYATLAFCKPVNVIEFLMGCVRDFRGVNDVKRFRSDVEAALKGLKVTVTHRKSKQKYTISGLAKEDARDCYFNLEDPEGKNPPQNIGLVNYFKEKWGTDIVHQNIPCLELGKNNKSNKVPMEFCVMVKGQVYRKERMERLNNDLAKALKKETLVHPLTRKNAISEMVEAADGPYGDVVKNFEMSVDQNMTRTIGRVIGAPQLRIGAPSPIRVDAVKCQWNLVDKPVLDGKPIERWALLDFTEGDRYNQLHTNAFVENLRNRCRRLGIQMDAPLSHRATRMNDFASVKRLENLLTNLVSDASRMNKGKLQLIVCVMTRKDPGYKSLKLISETQVGVVTQCCLSRPANEGKDQYLANLCLKINAKLGGNNFELSGKLPHFENKDHVMFIGADVNHPPPMNSLCPSIAAVVGTVNWPAANRYAARVSPQAHRKENIVNFGTICSNLVDTYAKLNKVRPNKIVVFRDGVSDDQFEMALGELLDLKNAINDGNYQPQITLVVAQKRHQTRLFVENRNDGGTSGNVPPGTVVDTTIVHPFDFDFYLCSHYGGLGTSKPTHYYVLWDENFFTSDEMQKLIYEMCFTFARCTKPVSLVPPVYYADLVAYRGRMFQEAMMESSLSSHASTSSRASDTPSFDASSYKMHPDLENIMFFV